MNIQAMMKQAQKLQKDMMNEKQMIDEKEFVGKASNVEVILKGTKEIKKVKINMECVEQDDIEMLEDMIVISINNALKQIDEETEKKLGKYTQGMPGLF
ncbi:MAG: YbaB/EbfC family nucleoid-associated protein [Bacilli bacterium]|nr:YbaB/EbfC family nucleoid-associated protein [Bacilli bacterium]